MVVRRFPQEASFKSTPGGKKGLPLLAYVNIRAFIFQSAITEIETPILDSGVLASLIKIFDKVGVLTRLELALFAVNQSLPVSEI